MLQTRVFDRLLQEEAEMSRGEARRRASVNSENYVLYEKDLAKIKEENSAKEKQIEAIKAELRLTEKIDDEKHNALRQDKFAIEDMIAKIDTQIKETQKCIHKLTLEAMEHQNS